MKYKLTISISILTILLFTGCAWFFDKNMDEKTAQELVNDGMEAFNHQQYRTAVDAFQKLKDWYPFSKYTILAELKIADSHYYMEEYGAAAVAYESFENLHPRNDAIPYVIFQLGMSYIHQMESIDRDQVAAKKAIEIFSRLKKSYPDSKYASQAYACIREATKNLAGHEFYIGEFYFKNNHYKAAVIRFKSVVADFPDVGLNQRALEYISKCEDALAHPEKASGKPWWRRLL